MNKNRITGTINVSPDKSISHRALLISAIARGTSRIKNFLYSADCLSTQQCLKKLGVDIEKNISGEIMVRGKSLQLDQPTCDLDAGNSGTTARLLAGILAGQNFTSRIIGDASLSRRPMQRIIEPLRQMGAKINSNNGLLPLEISGGKLKPINYLSPVASAQVKSGILLAGLYATGITSFTEPEKSRDHTERMLKNFGIEIEVKGNTVAVSGGKIPQASEISVPADFSSAAFFIVAASILPGSELLIKNVGVNPTRTGLLEVLKRMNADIKIENQKEFNQEPVADIVVRYSELKATEVRKEEIPRLIDEIPILTVAATQANGISRITGAEELRVKESDRLKTIASELKKMGARIEELKDGLVITGPTRLSGTDVNSYQDHRIAMALAIAGLVAEGETKISEPDCVNISFPEFFSIIKKVVNR